MKVTPATLQTMVENIRKYLSVRFPEALETIKKNPEKVSSGDLWKIWHSVTDEIRLSDDHPRFENRERILTHDFHYPLYPDGTNDATLQTALKKAMKML